MEAKKINLLELVPVRLCESEEGENGNVIVLLPKFRHPWLGWLQNRLKQKHFKVKLDEFGSHVWRACDGRQDVAVIADRFRERFGDVPQLYERLSKFLGNLERDGVIKLAGKEKNQR